MKKNVLTYCFVLLAKITFCQVEVSEPIKLNNADTLKEQIENLALPINKINAINANTYYNNYLLYGNTIGTGDSLDLTFSISFEKYYTGMGIYFTAPTNNNGAVYIQTNSLGFKEIKVFNRSLKPNEITANNLVSAIYNGNNFDLVTAPANPCPNGFVKVNRTFCVEVEESDSLSFFDANKACGDKNARLCTWSEWYQSCVQAGTLGINNTIGNFEWIDDSGNFVGGAVGAKVSGDVDCTSSYSQNTIITNKRNYRCCFSK